jgi:hypothetical protein
LLRGVNARKGARAGEISPSVTEFRSPHVEILGRGVSADSGPRRAEAIDLCFRSGLIKQTLNLADIVERSFSDAIRKGADFRPAHFS